MDAGASMHIISKKNFTQEELDTVRISRSRTTVITANASIDTNEEATAFVKYLYMFVTVQLFEDTRALLSLGKPCKENGYSNEWNEDLTPEFFLTKPGFHLANPTTVYLLLFLVYQAKLTVLAQPMIQEKNIQDIRTG